jgi:hypothetical protein
VANNPSISVRICAVIACVAFVAACTTHSQVRLSSTPIPQLRDGTCAEQKSDAPVVSCYEYTTMTPAGGVALGATALALGALLMVVGIRDFAGGLGMANDH